MLNAAWFMRGLAIAIAWIASLVATGMWAQGEPPVVLQTQSGQGSRVIPNGQPIGEIISSPDVGFQRIAKDHRQQITSPDEERCGRELPPNALLGGRSLPVIQSLDTLVFLW